MVYLQYFEPNVPIGIRRQHLNHVGGSSALLIDFKRHHKTKKCSRNPSTKQIYHFEQQVEHSRVGAPGSKTAPKAPKWVELMGFKLLGWFLAPSKSGRLEIHAGAHRIP